MKQVFRLGDVDPWKYFALLTVVFGFLFALLAPKGTTDKGFPAALFQWLIQVGLPMWLGIVVHISLHRVSRFDRWNPWLKLFLSGSVAALLFSPFAFFLDQLLGEGIQQTDLIRGWAQEFRSLYPPVVFCWMVINMPFNLGFRIQVDSEALPTVESPGISEEIHQEKSPNFLTLVQPQLRGELISLKSELHYLEVSTTAGRSLILYNLRDAIHELPPELGVQTHRSYWAALGQVQEFERRGREGILQMKDGSQIPVSRNRIAEIQNKLMSGQPR
jgi:hypothetical protein